MRLDKALEEKKMDLRLQDKMVTEGKLTLAQLEKLAEALPDDEKNSKMIDVAGRGTLR